jgi:hypothetical protein
MVQALTKETGLTKGKDEQIRELFFIEMCDASAKGYTL